MKKSADCAVAVDDVLQELGGFRRYQMRTLLLLCLPSVLGGMYNMNFLFTASDVDYRCKITECDGALYSPSFNASWVRYAAPHSSSRQCYRHPAASGRELDCSRESFNRSALQACTEWVYESSESIVSEFNLACEGWKRTLVGTVRSTGVMASLLITGQISDRLGRKIIICLAGTLAGILGVAKSFSSGYVMYVTLEFVEAALGCGFNSAVFILGIEFLHRDQRLVFSSILSTFYGLGGVVFAAIAWKVKYWRDLIRIAYAPAILLIFYIFLLDESVRWLIAKGDKDKALEIINKAAKINAVTISNDTLTQFEKNPKKINDIFLKEKNQKSPLRATLESKTMMKRFLICSVWWISTTFSYYGMSIQSVSMSGDKYLNYALTSIMEIPSHVLSLYVLQKCGRKKPMIFSFMSTGILCASLTFSDNSYPWLSLVLFLLGKLSASFTFSVVYVYTSELFPTYTRNSMHSLCSSVGRLGAILAPQTPLLEVYMKSLPSVLFGSASLLAGLLTLLTPDTGRDTLPDTVEQAERVENKDFPAPPQPTAYWCTTTKL